MTHSSCVIFSEGGDGKVVRPVDLQDNFSKAPAASRAQNIQQANPEMAHRNTAQEMTQQQVLDQSRTLPAEETDQTKLRPDDQKGEQRRNRQNAKREPEEESSGESAGAAEDEDTSHIDILA